MKFKKLAIERNQMIGVLSRKICAVYNQREKVVR